MVDFVIIRAGCEYQKGLTLHLEKRVEYIFNLDGDQCVFRDSFRQSEEERTIGDGGNRVRKRTTGNGMAHCNESVAEARIHAKWELYIEGRIRLESVSGGKLDRKHCHFTLAPARSRIQFCFDMSRD